MCKCLGIWLRKNLNNVLPSNCLIRRYFGCVQLIYSFFIFQMRFLDCREGRKDPSKSILDVGVKEAICFSGFDEKMFLMRGGKYVWSKADMKLEWWRSAAQFLCSVWVFISLFVCITFITYCTAYDCLKKVLNLLKVKKIALACFDRLLLLIALKTIVWINVIKKNIFKNCESVVFYFFVRMLHPEFSWKVTFFHYGQLKASLKVLTSHKKL